MTATNSQYEQCLFRIMRDVSWCHNYNINCSNRKTRAKFPGSLMKCIFILTKIDETPLQVAERLGHHHVKTYLLRLAGEVTDVQSDGTDLDISVNGKSYISSWERTIRKKKGEVWGDYSTLRVLVCLVYIVPAVWMFFHVNFSCMEFFNPLPLLFQWSIPSKLMVHGRCITRKTGILGTQWTRQEKGRINERDRCARKQVLARPLIFARLNFTLSLAPWNAYQAGNLGTR